MSQFAVPPVPMVWAVTAAVVPPLGSKKMLAARTVGTAARREAAAMRQAREISLR